MGDKGKAHVDGDKENKAQCMNMQNSVPTNLRKGTADNANSRKRNLRMPSFCKSLKTSSSEGRRQMPFPPIMKTADASSPNGNMDSSSALLQDRAPKTPLGKLRFSQESSSSAPKPPSCAPFPGHLLAEPSRAVGAGKGNSRLDNSSTGEHVCGYTGEHSTAGGDNDRNRRPNSSSTNPQSANPAADDVACDRNTRLNNTSPASGDDTLLLSTTLVQNIASLPPPLPPERNQEPPRVVGAGKGSSRLENSSTGYAVVMRRRFTVTSRLSCFHPSTGGGDDDCNTMPNSSFTNPQSKNPAAADASDRNTRLNKPSPDLSSAAASSPQGNTRFSRESSCSSPKTTSCAPSRVVTSNDIVGYKTNRISRRVPHRKDASSSKGNTDSSATISQETASPPPPPPQNHEDRMIEQIERITSLPPPPTSTEASSENTTSVHASIQTATATATVHTNSAPLSPNFSIIRQLTEYDMLASRPMLRFTKSCGLKIESLLLPTENSEIGVTGIITGVNSTKYGVIFKCYRGKYFLFRGWGNFRKANKWMKVGVFIEIVVFRDIQTGELTFQFAAIDE